MKQSGIPSLAVAGSSGSLELERAGHSLRKAKKAPAEKKPEVKSSLPIPPPAKREKIPAPPAAPRMKIEDWIKTNFGSQ